MKVHDPVWMQYHRVIFCSFPLSCVLSSYIKISTYLERLTNFEVSSTAYLELKYFHIFTQSWTVLHSLTV